MGFFLTCKKVFQKLQNINSEIENINVYKRSVGK